MMHAGRDSFQRIFYGCGHSFPTNKDEVFVQTQTSKVCVSSEHDRVDNFCNFYHADEKLRTDARKEKLQVFVSIVCACRWLGGPSLEMRLIGVNVATATPGELVDDLGLIYYSQS